MGKNLIKHQWGTFGILDIDGMEDPPLILYDGGVEERRNENYDFHNGNRKGYGGYLFQYTLEGEGAFEVGGKYHPLETGRAFLISFPEESRYYLPKGQKWGFCYLHFDGVAAKSFVDKIKKQYGSLFSLHPGSEPVDMILALHEKLSAGGDLKKYEGGEFLYAFLCALLRELEQPEGKDNSPLVERACGIMKNEYATLEGVEALSDRLGVSFAHFSRIFKAKTGLTPLRYLNNIRIQKAMNDLLSIEENLSVISKKNGFSGENYFCKVFRKNVGITPTEYRKRGLP